MDEVYYQSWTRPFRATSEPLHLGPIFLFPYLRQKGERPFQRRALRQAKLDDQNRDADKAGPLKNDKDIKR